MAKPTFSDDNLNRLLAALDAPIKPIVMPAAPKTQELTLGNWKPPAKKKASFKKKSKGKPNSIFHRVIDVLSRGNYASAEAFKEAFDPKTKQFYEPIEGLKGFVSGAKGKEKTRFSEVLKQHGHTGKGMGTLGVGLDIFADPLTYVGIGVVGKGAKGAEGASKLAKGAEALKPDVVQLGEMLSRGAKNKVTTGSFRSAAKVKPSAINATTPVAKAAANTAVIYKMLSAEPNIAPAEAASAAARIVKLNDIKTGLGKAKKRPKTFSVESLVTALETPPAVAALQKATAKVLKPAETVAPAKTAKAAPKQDIEALARKKADAKFDKEAGVSSSDEFSMSKVRARAAKGDKKAIRDLKLAESDSSYQSFMAAVKKNLVAKETKAVAKPVSDAPTVPDIITNNPVPDVAPMSLSQKLISTQDVIDETQTKAAQVAAKHALDSMNGAKKNNLANAKVKGHSEFTPIKQLNSFLKLRDELLVRKGWKKGTDRRIVMADPNFPSEIIAAWRHTEAVVEGLGKAPVAWQNDLTPLRLGDFLERMELDEWVNADPTFLRKVMTGETGIARYDEMRNAVLAGSHAEDATHIGPVIDTLQEAVGVAVKDPTNNATADLLASIKSMAKEGVKDAGASKIGQETAAKIADELSTAAKMSVTVDGQHVVGSVTKALEAARTATVAKDVKGATTAVERLARDTDKYLGIYMGGKPALKVMNLSKAADATGLKGLYEAFDKTEDWFALRFNTAFGKDAEGNVISMGPDLAKETRRATNNANQRSEKALVNIRNMFAGARSADDRLRMFRDMQVDEASEFSLRIKNAEDLANRNGIDIETVNDYYAKHYKKGEDLPFKLDKSNGWNTWKNPNSDVTGDVAQHLFKLETAVDKAVVDNNVYVNFGMRFGQDTPATGLKQAVGIHPRIDGKYFAPDDLKNLQNMQSMVRDLDNESSPLWQNFDKVQGIWKTMATRANPQYYVRNGIGEVFINWMHGVNSVQAYGDARKVISWKMPEVAVDASTTAKTTAGTVLFKHPLHGNMTTDRAWQLYSNSGARQTFAVTDDLTDASLNKAPGRAMQALNTVADTEEGFLRMAHFIDIMRKTKIKDVNEAAFEAAATVNRAHGDYSALTKFERKVMKRIVPFYTWQKKVTPILLESALRNPGKAMVYPKIQIMLSQHFGTELDNENPFPSPQFLLPDYLADGAAVPYYTGSNGNPVLGNPGNPFNDQLQEITKPEQFAENSLSPAVKIPAEMLLRKTENNPKGTKFFGDIPIQDRSDYLADQIPLLSTYNRITRQDVGVTDRERGKDEQGTNFIALMNWLTASRLTEVTSSVEKSGKYDKDARDKKKKAEAKK